MQHLVRGRIAKSDVRTYHIRTYVRTYASSTVSRHFGAETKITADWLEIDGQLLQSTPSHAMQAWADNSPGMKI